MWRRSSAPRLAATYDAKRSHECGMRENVDGPRDPESLEFIAVTLKHTRHWSQNGYGKSWNRIWARFASVTGRRNVRRPTRKSTAATSRVPGRGIRGLLSKFAQKPPQIRRCGTQIRFWKVFRTKHDLRLSTVLKGRRTPWRDVAALRFQLRPRLGTPI